MKIDETFDRFAALDAEWRKQEAARTSHAWQADAATEARADDGYASLFELMAEAQDLDPPADLPRQIASAVEARVHAARQVDAFRRRIRRCMTLPVAVVVLAAATNIDIQALASALSATAWLYLPALALLLGGLPIQLQRAD